VPLLQQLVRLLDLAHPPVAVTFHHEAPDELRGTRPGPEPAGCCFWQPAEKRRQPLDEADDADVILVRLTASSLMSLQGACPELSVVTKPQCQIVPLALEGLIAVSPGCAASRVGTGLPANELSCALPARDLPDIVARLTRSRAADAAVSAYADSDLHANCTPA
jgi:uncharacterized protein (DUF169 family)